MVLSTRKKTVLPIALLLLGLALISAFSVVISRSNDTSALSGANFNAGQVIDDSVFYNSSSMTVSQIQSFLNSKVSNCDTNGTQPYAGTTRAAYGASRGYPAPYTCLKDYSQNVPAMIHSGSDLCPVSVPTSGVKSAAQIIYDVAQSCRINPQVLLVLLEKEQGLVSDDWPWSIQYRSATGYGCPDTAACDSDYYGFFNQVFNSAQAYRRYAANPTNYNYRAGRNNSILYNPDSSCGSSNVYIQNQATASLYIYTPYQPNQAALNNLYGSGDGCSSYGNRNFWRLFNDWFGSSYSYSIISQVQSRYDSIGTMGLPAANGYCNNDQSACWQQFQNGWLIYSSGNGTWENNGSIRTRWGQLGYQTGTMGYPIGPEVYDGNGWWQSYQNGAIIGSGPSGYWESTGSIRTRWGQLGYQTGTMGYPVGAVTNASDGSAWQQYQNGWLFQTPSSGTWESKGSIRTRWSQLGYQSGLLGFPTGPEVASDKDWWQSYQNGAIIGSATTGFWESAGPLRTRWGQLGYQGGSMGYPIGPIITSGNGSTSWQQYQNGWLIQSNASGAWESKGAIRDYWASTGYQSGQAGLPTGPEVYDSSTATYSQQYQNGIILYNASTGGRFVKS